MSQILPQTINVNKINFISDSQGAPVGSLSFDSQGLIINYNNDPNTNIVISSSGVKGNTGPTGPTGPSGGGSGGSSIYSGMTGVNSDNGNATIVTGNPGTSVIGTPLFTDISSNQVLFDLSSYFDTNTNIININTSFSLLYTASNTIEIFYYCSCFSNIDGTGTKLESTPELSIFKRSISTTVTSNSIIPLYLVLKNGVHFDSTHKYLQIFLFATSTTTVASKISSLTVPVTIFSI